MEIEADTCCGEVFFITCRYYYYYYYRFIFYLVHLTLLMPKVAKVNVQQNFQILFCNVLERCRLKVRDSQIYSISNLHSVAKLC